MSDLVLEMSKVTFDRIGQAIHDTFSSVLSLKLEVLNVDLGPLPNAPKSISGFVILRNPEVQGTFSINFPSETALQIFSAFYGSKIEQIDERVLEGVGEITNMVYGCFKKGLNEEGFDLQMFIPFIMIGSEFNHLKERGSKNAVNIHFGSSVGNFWVELNMQKAQELKATSKKSTRKAA